jgi:hypothetical protein
MSSLCPLCTKKVMARHKPADCCFVSEPPSTKLQVIVTARKGHWLRQLVAVTPQHQKFATSWCPHKIYHIQLGLQWPCNSVTSVWSRVSQFLGDLTMSSRGKYGLQLIQWTIFVAIWTVLGVLWVLGPIMPGLFQFAPQKACFWSRACVLTLDPWADIQESKQAHAIHAIRSFECMVLQTRIILEDYLTTSVVRRRQSDAVLNETKTTPVTSHVSAGVDL